MGLLGVYAEIEGEENEGEEGEVATDLEVTPAWLALSTTIGEDLCNL